LPRVFQVINDNGRPCAQRGPAVLGDGRRIDRAVDHFQRGARHDGRAVRDAFLFGAQVDALVREETEGDPSGRSPRRRKLSR
jgi:hypothetical protein